MVCERSNVDGWEAGRTKELLRTRVFSVIEQSFRAPDGRPVTRQTVMHKGAVAVLPFVTDSDVLLVRQFRPSVGKTIIEAPAGTLEEGETPARCAERELAEEAGYRSACMEPLGTIFTTPGFCSEVLHLFRASRLSRTDAARDDDEFLDALVIPFRRALDMCLAGEIEDAKTLALFLRCILRDGRLPR